MSFLSGAFYQMRDHEKVNVWKSQKIITVLFELIQVDSFAIFSKASFSFDVINIKY